MTGDGAATIPLIERADDAVLFRTAGKALNTQRLLRDVNRLAGDLPGAAYLCNLCQDRYRFVVTLLAAALRGSVNLLSSDRSRGTLRSLAERFDRVISVSDAAMPDNPLKHHVVSLQSDLATDPVANPTLPADQLIAIVFTSGTTGIPVGHSKTWGALATRSRAAGYRFGMTAAAPAGVVGTVPPQHMYGFETTVLLPLHAMAASWCGPAFYPRDVADALGAMPAPRMLITTPLQIRSLLDAGIAMPVLDCVISATAALAPELAAAAELRWRTRVLEIYGATEVGSIASRRTIEGPIWTTYDQILLEAEPAKGLVRVKAPYGEVHPLADLIEQQSSTEFQLIGRSIDMVKLGGRRASLAGLNAILTNLPGVHDGMFVVPDDLDHRNSARLLAFVIAPERTPEDLLSELRTRIEPVFLPRRIIRVASLPRNEMGKLPRAALLNLLARSDEKAETNS
jgi:acyl-coenzyme A synthetase/AMP-(fatty) acid ligase